MCAAKFLFFIIGSSLGKFVIWWCLWICWGFFYFYVSAFHTVVCNLLYYIPEKRVITYAVNDITFSVVVVVVVVVFVRCFYCCCCCFCCRSCSSSSYCCSSSSSCSSTSKSWSCCDIIIMMNIKTLSLNRDPFDLVKTCSFLLDLHLQRSWLSQATRAGHQIRISVSLQRCRRIHWSRHR